MDAQFTPSTPLLQRHQWSDRRMFRAILDQHRTDAEFGFINQDWYRLSIRCKQRVHVKRYEVRPRLPPVFSIDTGTRDSEGAPTAVVCGGDRSANIRNNKPVDHTDIRINATDACKEFTATLEKPDGSGDDLVPVCSSYATCRAELRAWHDAEARWTSKGRGFPRRPKSVPPLPIPLAGTKVVQNDNLGISFLTPCAPWETQEVLDTGPHGTRRSSQFRQTPK